MPVPRIVANHQEPDPTYRGSHPVVCAVGFEVLKPGSG
jgi:hypothetical protein